MNNKNLYSLSGKRVWVAGHGGLVGSSLTQRLDQEECELLTVDRDRLDLRRQTAVEQWLAESKPDAIFLAAAKVGGIQANAAKPAEFLYDNMLIEANIIHAAYQTRVEKLLFLGSTCIYPKFSPQPIPERALLTGPLEPTNQWYALAKIAGIYLCQAYRQQYGCNFISVMPTNLYGPGDFFETENSHVIPALISKIYTAIENNSDTVEIWGSGNPLREFLYAEDAADALVYLMSTYSGDSHVNLGSGKEIRIIDLANMIADIAGYKGAWDFDKSREDGTPRKLSDVQILTNLGWRPKTALRDGLERTYNWFCTSYKTGNIRT